MSVSICGRVLLWTAVFHSFFILISELLDGNNIALHSLTFLILLWAQSRCELKGTISNLKPKQDTSKSAHILCVGAESSSTRQIKLLATPECNVS